MLLTEGFRNAKLADFGSAKSIKVRQNVKLISCAVSYVTQPSLK